MKKIHLHEEQFDGVPHSWCGRGDTAVVSDIFEATAPEKRCKLCDMEWFPTSQPRWHYEAMVRRLAEEEGIIL